MEDKWASEPDISGLRESYQKLKTDPKAAIRELTEHAAKGSLMSMVYIGYAHQKGTGVQKNLGEAERWYRMAYDAGSLEGLRHLGVLLTEVGRFDEAEAVFLEGVAKDYSPVMHRLGKLYLRSNDPGRWKRAIPVLERGSELGNVFSKRSMAGLLLSGRLGWKNVPRGIKLLKESVLEAFDIGRREPRSDRIKY